MRELLTHRDGSDLNAKVKVEVADEPDKKSGAHHRYDFYLKQNNLWEKGGGVRFQKGPTVRKDAAGNVVGDNLNGISNEALLAVVLDRLRSFQCGSFPCRENEHTIRHLEEALHWLGHRARDRIERGVEGKEEK